MEICQRKLTLQVPTFKVIKVTGSDTDQSATYEFLLVFSSNYGPIVYGFQDKFS